MDVTELIKALVNEVPTLRSSSLHLVGESYGAKFAAMIGVNVARSIRAGSLNLTLGGVVLGDGWVSPVDFALSYPWFLQSMSRLDGNAVGTAITMGITIRQQVAARQYLAAYKTFAGLMEFIDYRSGQVNHDNILVSNTIPAGPNNLSDVINSVIKEEFEIIPMNLTWQAASLNVFEALKRNFMRPSINEVDELLMYGVSVTVYNGQLDLIRSTLGAESWLKKLKWDGLHKFLSLPRDPLQYCDPLDDLPDAFVQSYRNLHFYWILGAGHMVPKDQPCTAVHMIGAVIGSPAS